MALIPITGWAKTSISDCTIGGSIGLSDGGSTVYINPTSTSEFTCATASVDLRCCTRLKMTLSSNGSTQPFFVVKIEGVSVLSQRYGGTVYIDVPESYRISSATILIRFTDTNNTSCTGIFKNINKEYDATVTSIVFSATPTSGNTSTSFVFSSTVTGCPATYTYLWDFGDGNTSTSANPTHTYASPGYKTISLTVTNGGGARTHIITDYITVTDTPTSLFYGSPTIVKTADTVSLVSESYGFPSISAYEWKIGYDTDTPSTSPPSGGWDYTTSNTFNTLMQRAYIGYFKTVGYQKAFLSGTPPSTTGQSYGDFSDRENLSSIYAYSDSWELFAIDSGYYVNIYLDLNGLLGSDNPRDDGYPYVKVYFEEPTAPIKYDFWYDESTHKLYRYTGSSWDSGSSYAANAIEEIISDGILYVSSPFTLYCSTSQPESPTVGDIYLNTSTNTVRIYDGESFIFCNDSSLASDILAELPEDFRSTNSTVIYSETEPTISGNMIWVELDNYEISPNYYTSYGTSSPWNWYGDSDYDDENPIVTLNSVGKYTVVLKVTNTDGDDTLTKTDYLEAATVNNPSFSDFKNKVIIISKNGDQLRRF